MPTNNLYLGSVQASAGHELPPMWALCATCSSAESCASCGNDAVYDSARAFCLCRSQYYLQGQTCAVCFSRCLTCSARGCTACLSNYQLKDQQCGCSPSLYQDLSGCTPCPQNCTLCTNAANCTACPQGFSLTDSRCLQIVVGSKSMRIYAGSPANLECAGRNIRAACPNCHSLIKAVI